MNVVRSALLFSLGVGSCIAYEVANAESALIGISGTITYKVALTNQHIPDRLLKFDFQTSASEWRAKIVELKGNRLPGSIVPLFEYHHWITNLNVNCVHFDPSSMPAPRASRHPGSSKQQPKLFTVDSEVYEQQFPFWDDWGLTALWLTFKSGDYFRNSPAIPGTLYTMDKESELPLIRKYSLVQSPTTGIVSGLKEFSVLFSTVFTNHFQSLPLFEFHINSFDKTTFGEMPQMSETIFSRPLNGDSRSPQFEPIVVIEVRAKSWLALDKFTIDDYEDESSFTTAIKDYRIRTKEGKPISYWSTNGFPSANDPRLARYNEKYTRLQKSLADAKTKGNSHKPKAAVIIVLLFLSLGFGVFLYLGRGSR